MTAHLVTCQRGCTASGAQEFKRLFGEHHAKTPGGAGGVLFKQIDPGVRVAPFPEIGEIEAAGAAADHGDTHNFILPQWRCAPSAVLVLRWLHVQFPKLIMSVRVSVILGDTIGAWVRL